MGVFKSFRQHFKENYYQYADNATVAGLADKPESLARSFYRVNIFIHAILALKNRFKLA